MKLVTKPNRVSHIVEISFDRFLAAVPGSNLRAVLARGKEYAGTDHRHQQERTPTTHDQYGPDFGRSPPLLDPAEDEPN